MISSPAISVLMPAYNAESYIGEAIDSILAQTLDDFELFIFDDGSSDSTLDIISKYTERDKRVRLFSGGHHGLSHWLNVGLAEARGRLIARMDADDISLPDRFMRQMEFLDAHPDHVAVGGWFVTIDPDGAAIAPVERPTGHLEIDNRHMGGVGGGIMHPAAMIQASALTAIGRYRKELEPAEDLDLFLRLAEVGKLANLPQCLLKYRLHPKSVSHMRAQVQARMMFEVVRQAHLRRGLPIDHLLPQVPMMPEEVGGPHSYWASLALQAGNRQTAIKHAWCAAKSSLFSSQCWTFLRKAVESDGTEGVSSAHFVAHPLGWAIVKAWSTVLNMGAAVRRFARSVLARTPVMWRLVSHQS